MKKTFIIATIIGMAMMVTSCGNSSSSDSRYTPNDDWSSTESDDNYYSNDQRTEYVRCPLCNGTGTVYLVPGDYMSQQTCEACRGTGQCDENIARQIQQMYDDIHAMAGGGYNNGGGYYDGGGYSSGRSAYEIEYDLQRAQELLEDLEESYNECSSGVLRAQYPSMIAEQRARIAQLEAELRNAQ